LVALVIVSSAARPEAPEAVQACHELMGWLIPQLDKFPRSRRFTLGERLETGLLEVLEKLVEASYSKAKQAPLRVANLRLEVLRHLWRLVFELGVSPLRRYEHGAEQMNDLRRQIGGWIRHLDGRARNRCNQVSRANAAR